MFHRGMATGCSADNRKTTLAILSATSVEQLPAAIAMATAVLAPAAAINNSSPLAIFGTGLSDARPAAVDNVRFLKSIAESGDKIELQEGLVLDGVHVIVGAHDLSMLRFAPSVAIGELCRIPGCADPTGACDVPLTIEQMGVDSITAAIECLRRLPPVEGDVDDLPLEWQDHSDDVASFQWVSDLWKQTQKAKAKEEAEEEGVTPFDVLSLAMYAKAVGIAVRTTSMAHETLKRIVATVDGAVGLGLTSLFPVDGAAPSALAFLSGYLVGDDRPWQVTPRGKSAAKKARVVLAKVFAHAETVLSVLEHSKLAEVVGGAEEGGGSVLLVQGGPKGITGRLIAGRLPVRASATNYELSVEFGKPKSKESWTSELNADLREVVDVLRGGEEAASDKRRLKRVQQRIGAYAALASTDLVYETDERSTTAVLASQHHHAVTTFPSGIAAHVVRELVLKPSTISVASTTACVGVQTGTSIACSFCTFCPSTMWSLRSPPFVAPDVSPSNIAAIQADVDTIATAIDRPYRPLGMLIGTLGPVVEVEGERRRICYWRSRSDDRDSLVSFVPAAYTDVVFGDYATGSRNLRASDHADDEATPPFFVADTVFAVSTSSALPGSGGLVFSVPKLDKVGLLGTDEAQLYEAYVSGVQAAESANRELVSSLERSFRTFYVRETENDLLAGLRVQWSKASVTDARGSPATIFGLVSDNSTREQLLF